MANTYSKTRTCWHLPIFWGSLTHPAIHWMLDTSCSWVWLGIANTQALLAFLLLQDWPDWRLRLLGISLGSISSMLP